MRSQKACTSHIGTKYKGEEPLPDAITQRNSKCNRIFWTTSLLISSSLFFNLSSSKGGRRTQKVKNRGGKYYKKYR